MKHRTLQQTAQYDTPQVYATAADLRQVKDGEWALGLLPERQFRSCLDIGCGIGELLGQLGVSGKVSGRLMGIDRSGDMVKAARERLHPLSGMVDVRLRQANVLDLPKIAGPFDLVTLMAVQHWLYPDEASVFSWIAARLERYGVFGLTTYHPTVNRRFVGGSDEVVLEAMEQIGAPTAFPAGFLPIGRRTRSPEEIELLLRRSFRVYEVHVRPALTRATSSQAYAAFHTATFGTYYAQLLPLKWRTRFLEAVGDVAMRRMNTLGYVTSMQVRFWVCGRGAPLKNLNGWGALQVLKSA